MNSAPATISDDVPDAGVRCARATRIGTRKSARVRPRSAAVRAVESRDGDRHRGSVVGGRVGVRPTRRSLASGFTRTGRPGRSTGGSRAGPDRPPRASRRRRRGRTRARSIGHGIAGREVEPAAGQDDHQRRRRRARATTPSERPGQPEDAGLDDDRAPDLARVIPAARRMPISRTRSMTFIVSVLTMPSAATMTATTASASNSPKIRPSASLDGALDPVERSRPRGPSWRAVSAEVVAGRGRARSGAKRTAKASAPATPRRPSRRSSRRASTRRRGRAASLDDPDDAQVEPCVAVGRGHGQRLAEPRGRAARRAPPARSPRRRRRAPRAPPPGRPPTNVSRPSAARSAPTTAAPSVRVAVERDVERRDRADPGDAGDRVERPRRRPRPAAIGRIEVTTTSPGTTSAIQPAAAARACWPTPPSATIIASPTVSAPRSASSGSGRAATDAAGEPLLEPEQERERRAGDPGEGRQRGTG